VMYHWGALPGGGAVKGRDGFDQIGPLNSLGNLIVPNCETYEHFYPVHFLQHELRCDAAGPGQYRGGTGAVYRVVVEQEAEFAFRGEGQRTPSGYGVLGGEIGAAGSVRFEFPDGTSWIPPQFGVGRLGPVTVNIHSPAGGGWGDPRRRDPGRVLQDVRDGILSREAAREVYGVILSIDGRGIDDVATANYREQL
jgi:N-methylhydantoinase B